MGTSRQLDIFGYALNAERDGMNFYLKASRKFKDEKDLKNLFTRLAKEEAKHMEIFIGLRARMEGKDIEECFRVQDIDAYLESVIQDGMFPRGENATKRLAKVDSVGSACAMAIQAEKTAILLYTELTKLAKDREQKRILEAIAGEEKTHLVMVGSLRADFDPMYAALKFGRFF
jgi:rubrerythrin